MACCTILKGGMPPFFQSENLVFKEREWDLANSDSKDPLINLSRFWNFEVDALKMKTDSEKTWINERKEKILSELLPFRQYVFSLYKNTPTSEILTNAISHIQKLSTLLGKDNCFLNWDKGYVCDVDAVFIAAGALIFKKFDDKHLEFSKLYKELERHTNLFWMVQKYFDRHIKPHPDIVSLSSLIGDNSGIEFDKYLQSYEIIKSSSTAQIYLCEFSLDNPLKLPPGRFIIKKYFSTDDTKIKGCRDFISESYYLRQLRHDNVVEMIAAAETQDINFIVLRYYEDGDLASLIGGAAGPSLSWTRTLDILIQVSYILHMLHAFHPQKPQLVYSDFKPANFLLNGNTICLCDLASISLEGNPLLTESPPYIEDCAAHVYGLGKLLAPSGDIYKFGKFMILLLTKEPIEEPILGEKIAKKLEVMKFSDLIRQDLLVDNCPTDVKQILDLAILCLHQNSICRPTASKIVDTLRRVQEHSQTDLPST